MNPGYQQNVTMINELPELEDLEGPRPFQPAIRNQLKGYMSPENKEFQKYIREGHTPLQESGMHSSQQNYQFEPYYNPEFESNNLKEEGIKTYAMPENTPNCVEIAEHVANCPVCSKFYNNDKTIYVIAIVILAILCILLLKKVLDV